jgi:hypothetical protein
MAGIEITFGGCSAIKGICLSSFLRQENQKMSAAEFAYPQGSWSLELCAVIRITRQMGKQWSRTFAVEALSNWHFYKKGGCDSVV